MALVGFLVVIAALLLAIPLLIIRAAPGVGRAIENTIQSQIDQAYAEPDAGPLELTSDEYSAELAAAVADGLAMSCMSRDDSGGAVSYVTWEAEKGNTAWRPYWMHPDDEWRWAPGPSTLMSSSADGTLLCLDEWATVPDGLSLNNENMRQAQLVILCGPTGNNPRVAALTILVGGGPHFAFNQAGTRLYGSPILPCAPTPAGYAEYINDPGGERDWPEYNYIDLESWEPGFQPDLYLGDGFWKCPYSDNFRIENNWYAVHEFSNLTGGGILGRWASPDGVEAHIDGWVLEDAVLLIGPSAYGLLWVDGRFIAAPHQRWRVYCWLSDGTYIFSDDGGESVKYGKVDWSSFSVDWWVDRPDLTGYTDYVFHPVAGSEAVFIHDQAAGRLWHTTLTREGARP